MIQRAFEPPLRASLIENILQLAGIGFIAQLVNGAIGMAYGITSSSILLALGVTPIVASASAHTAEAFTTGALALSHWRHGNIDRSNFKRKLVPEFWAVLRLRHLQPY